jgi:capsular polysaccharide biosynthesis protein
VTSEPRPRIRTKRRLTSLPPAFRGLWRYAKRAHVLLTATLAPARQALSRLLGGQLPRRTARTVEEIVTRGEGTMTVARAEQALTRAVPTGVPAEHRVFAAESEELVPRLAVAELPGGRVLGPYRAVITAGGTLVGELSPYFGTRSPAQNPVFLERRPGPATVIEGRVGVLTARGDVSYYHYLTDVLPRLEILERLDPSPERLYLPASLPFQRQLLELLQIPSERIIDADRVRHLKAGVLVVPGLPDADLKTPPWVVSWLRERLLSREPPAPRGRRLYLSRGRRRGSRIVRNEPEVVDALATLGFEVLDPGAMPVAEQIATFAAADLVVGPHGAALANLAFVSPGAGVVELFAPDYVQGCYWKICACLPGVTYRYLVGVGKPPRRGRMDGVDSDITIDVADLLGLLEGLLSDDQVVGREVVPRP